MTGFFLDAPNHAYNSFNLTNIAWDAKTFPSPRRSFFFVWQAFTQKEILCYSGWVEDKRTNLGNDGEGT